VCNNPNNKQHYNTWLRFPSLGCVSCVAHSHVPLQLLVDGPYSHISVSPTGKNVACCNAEGDLIVVTSDFSNTLSRFKTKIATPPLELIWCSPDAVLLHYPSLLVMVNSLCDHLTFELPAPVVVVGEMDGARVVSRDCCKFLQRVASM
jgi:vacuolar protein sorting-associated protein 16